MVAISESGKQGTIHQDVESNLCHVQPDTVFRCVMEIMPFRQPYASMGSNVSQCEAIYRECQIIHDQTHAVCTRIVVVEHKLDLHRPVLSAAVTSH
jgi:hypothetical protein